MESDRPARPVLVRLPATLILQAQALLPDCRERTDVTGATFAKRARGGPPAGVTQVVTLACLLGMEQLRTRFEQPAPVVDLDTDTDPSAG